MAFASWLGLARDVAAMLVVGAALLSAVVLWSGAAGGVAASVAVVSAAGLAGLALQGLLGGLFELPTGAVGAVTAAVLLAGAFYGAHVYGVRGLWVAALSVVGVGLAWGLLWAFEARLGQNAPALGPMLALLILATLSLGALGAAARSAIERSDAAAGDPPLLAARRMLATPPAWFDCAYATLGGAAAQPGKCAFTPPEVASAPPWSAAPEAPTAEAAPRAGLDAAARSGGPSDGAGPRVGASPAAPAAPKAPTLDTPSFDTALGAAENLAPAAPVTLSSPENADAPALGDVDPVEESPTPEMDPAASAPEIGVAPSQPTAPAPSRRPERSAAPDRVALAEPQAVAADAGPDAAAAPQRSVAERDRPKSAFVCFPMTSLAAERLCPDQRFDVADLGVRWEMRGGEAIDAPEGVDCAVDAEIGLHATLFVNLSGDLAGPLAARAGDEPRARKADILYDAATRMLGAARGAAEKGAPTRLSLYVSGGSSLLSPWAEQSFSPERSDRLFDLASSGQSLSLLRRLKSEVEALRKSTPARDLAAALEAMIADRPEARLDRAQSTVILATDDLALAGLDAAEADRVGDALRSAGLPVIAVSIGEGGPSPVLIRLAERSGGSAFGVSDGEALFKEMRRGFERARRFCAVRVTAPERFFREGELQLRLRRRMTDGCALDQIATVSCDGLRLEERIDPNAE